VWHDALAMLIRCVGIFLSLVSAKILIGAFFIPADEFSPASWVGVLIAGGVCWFGCFLAFG
jgi:hypothetical protein